MRRVIHLILGFLILCTLASCIDGILGTGEDGDDTHTGTITVATETHGSETDPNGYSIALDDSASTHLVGANEKIHISDVPEGHHSVNLDRSSLLSGCSVSGERNRRVAVFADDTTEISYQILCRLETDNKIAFTSNRDGNNEIYLMDADGSDVIRLTDNELPDYEPVISNDGNYIAFSRYQNGALELYTLNINSSNVRQVTNGTNPLGNYSWSPDDSKLVYAASYPANNSTVDREIYTINRKGTGRKQLTDNTLNDYEPSWSSDGTIAFSSVRSGDPKIYAMDSDGGNLRQLTSGHGRQPSWSADGNRLVFHSDREERFEDELFVIRSDGTQLRRVTDNDIDEVFPDWSPDGNSIVFHTSRGDSEENIYKINADGSGSPVNLTESEAADYSPDWSPVE